MAAGETGSRGRAGKNPVDRGGAEARRTERNGGREVKDRQGEPGEPDRPRVTTGFFSCLCDEQAALRAHVRGADANVRAAAGPTVGRARSRSPLKGPQPLFASWVASLGLYGGKLPSDRNSH